MERIASQGGADTDHAMTASSLLLQLFTFTMHPSSPTCAGTNSSLIKGVYNVQLNEKFRLNLGMMVLIK